MPQSRPEIPFGERVAERTLIGVSSRFLSIKDLSLSFVVYRVVRSPLRVAQMRSLLLERR